MELIATAAFGLEGLVKEELNNLGFSATAKQGGASFTTDYSGAFKANLWLSCADRVLLVAGQQMVSSFEELFTFVYSLPWEDLLPRNAVFPVSGNCARSKLMSVSDCQSITKKAIVERLKTKYNTNWFPENGSKYQINVAIHKDLATITLDTSGDALNKRGYRTWVGEAPLRETLAAALIRLSPWKVGQALHDPCCGTGTLLIEAAYLAANRAPGLTRTFAMEDWEQVSKRDCDRIRKEASLLYKPESIQLITGSDKDPEALELSRRHILQAGLEGKISVFEQDVRNLQLDQTKVCFLANPPYGERIGDRKNAALMAASLGALQNRHLASSLCVITADPAFEKHAKKSANKRRRLYNGRLECEFLIIQ